MNFEAYGRVESRKMRKFVLRAASRPNQIEFSHGLGPKKPRQLAARKAAYCGEAAAPVCFLAGPI